MKSKTFYNLTNPIQELSNIINIINSIENTKPIKLVNELSKAERNALKELTNNPNIVLQKSDKLNTLVTLNKGFYLKKLVNRCHLDSKMIVTVTDRFFQN